MSGWEHAEAQAEAAAEERAAWIADELEQRFEDERRARLEADRLTDGDRARIRAAMADAASKLPSSWSGEQRLGYEETAARLGANAIGCGFHDLREVEEAWIRAEARRALVGLPALQAALDRANAELAEAREIGDRLAARRASHRQATAFAAHRAARILLGEIPAEEI